MSPFLSHSTILPSKEELNSEPFWFNGTIGSGFDEGSIWSPEYAYPTLDGPLSLPTGHQLPSFEDYHLGPPPPQSGGEDHVDSVGLPVDAYNVPLGVRPEDLFDPPYQTTYRELFDENYNTCVPADVMTMQQPVPALINTLDQTTFFAPVDLSTSDGDDEHPQTRGRGKRGITSQPKSPPLPAFSPSGSTSSGSEKSSPSPGHPHPYKRYIPSRNIQCQEDALFVDGASGFECPICGRSQQNRRIPDLKRHIETHLQWREPGKWTCCGVGMDRAHLYREDIKQGMSEEEYIKAGAYRFKGKLMIGGCMKTFSRRDALKRHVDNPNIPCLGHMHSYNL